MAYVEVSEASDFLRNTIVADEVEIQAALSAAENAVNSYCQRIFTVPTEATTRTFVGYRNYELDVPDIANTTGLIIVNNGATLTAADYQLEISPGVTGPIGVDGRTWPYVRIQRISGYWDVNEDHKATISITARWGWPAIPSEVEMATKLLARDYLLARDIGFGIVQVGDFSRRVAANGVVTDLLGPLRRGEAWGIG